MVTDFDLIDDIHTFDHAAKNRILAVQERRRLKANIELAAARFAIRVYLVTSPRHCHSAAHVLFSRTDFCWQIVPGAPGAITRRVAALDDKARFNPMERQLVV